MIGSVQRKDNRKLLSKPVTPNEGLVSDECRLSGQYFECDFMLDRKLQDEVIAHIVQDL